MLYDLTQEEWEKFQEVPDESFQTNANMFRLNQSADNGILNDSEEVKLLEQLSINTPEFFNGNFDPSILVKRLPDSKLPKIK